MGYQEKRVWVLFGTQLVVYGGYFWVLHHRHVHLSDTLWLILGMVVLQIILQSLLAITSNPEQRDERDRAIENTAFRAAYFALVCAVVFSVVVFAHRLGFSGGLTTMHVVNTLLFALALGELTKLGAQIALYRRTA